MNRLNSCHSWRCSVPIVRKTFYLEIYNGKIGHKDMKQLHVGPQLRNVAPTSMLVKSLLRGPDSTVDDKERL